MLKERCATCTEYVNCSRRGKGCMGRKSRKRAFAEFEEAQNSHPPLKADVVCESCDKTVEKELKILRRNVKFLAGCQPAAKTETAREDPMVSFVVSGAHRIKAHRSILAGVSPVFEKMFSVGMLERETGKVSITDASLSTMKAIVKYCYTADVTFSVDIDLDEMTHISHKYEINSLKDRCETELCSRFCNSMKTTVDLSRALGMTEKLLATAERYEMDRLRKTCMKELHLRNYIVKEKCEMDRLRNASVKGRNSRSYMVDDRTSPRALAKLMHLSFKFGTEDMQDGIYKTVKSLNDDEEKQVWMEVMKPSFVQKDRMI